MENIGNLLNKIVNQAKFSLFDQGELAQLTYDAFDIAARTVQASEHEEIQIKFPVGYRPDKTAIESTRTYKKEELLGRYQFLAFLQLFINGLVQLVTIVEAMLSDVVRSTVLKYPQKLGTKRNVSMYDVLQASNIEEVHVRATDGLLNELAYKSPAEFAESMQKLLSINLMECPAFHKYVEAKATRDIYIHNRGIANETYIRKVGMHARVKAGMNLPVDVQYFLETYESCLQMIEWMESELHQHWHSSDFEDRQNQKSEIQSTEQDTK